MEPSRHTSVLQFGTYEIALQSGELRKAGVRIKVQQQPLKLLELLLEHPGEVVTREQLRSRIWPNESYGDFDQAVNVAIAKLRGALGDSADNPRYIETLPRRGYRFIAQVVVVKRPTNQPELLGEVAAPEVAERAQPEAGGRMERPRHLPGRFAWKMLGIAMAVATDRA
jgi:DNA-binding winged helix-turn-helix (wHTH) protein